MSIQTKFNLYISELDKNLSSLIEEEINQDLEIVNNILDISQTYQDELGLNFKFSLYYYTSPTPIVFKNGSYEYDRNHKLGFTDIKKMVRAIDRGYTQINIDLDSSKAKFDAQFQKQSDKFKNNILKFYPDAQARTTKFAIIVSYKRN